MSQDFDENLLIVDGESGPELECKSCGEQICGTDELYKEHLLQAVRPLEDANQLLVDPSQYIDDEMEYREYYCPGCGLMIENEVILAESEPVSDKEVSTDT